MQNLVLCQTDELRQIIREELLSISVPYAEPKQTSKPITQKELCSFLGISEPTIIAWRKKGKIPFIEIGSVKRYDVAAVLKSLEVTNKKGASR